MEYIVSEEELRECMPDYMKSTWEVVSVFIKEFLKSKQQVEVLASGEVMIDEEDTDDYYSWIGDSRIDSLVGRKCKDGQHIKIYIEVSK